MSPGPHTLQGSCHCQQIRFTARGVGFDDLHKCNCAYCIKRGLFHVVLRKGSIELEPGSGESDGKPVVLDYAQEIPAGYEGKIAYYLSNGEKSQTRWYSCTKCHILVFTTFPAPENVEVGCTVSLRVLDLAPSGKSIKDLTHREAVQYDDMQSEVEQNRRNEPWEGGEW